MQNLSQHDLDRRLSLALDGAGIVGERFRQSLVNDVKSKVLLRGARDRVRVAGAPGTGRHAVVSVAHLAAQDLLERSAERVDLDCSSWGTDFADALSGALDQARGGTLILDRVETLDSVALRELDRIVARDGDGTFVMEVTDASTARRVGTEIVVKPLHEREEDLWELIDHFFDATVAEADLIGCRGFSRQAKADLAQVVQETALESVRRLRDIVRDLVFGAAASGPLPLKLTSEMVRPVLESMHGQTADDREARDAALVSSQFDAVVTNSLVGRLAETHGVPEELLLRQAELLREVVSYIDDVPRSYRNIMDRSDDIMRASLWVLSGASTQAEFRRFFGEERFMRPTKSVAWAFYNRVFKRDA